MTAEMTGRDGAIDFAAKQGLVGTALDHGHTYRVIEIVGTSDKGIDDAVRSAIERAHQTIRHLRWFEIVRTSGHVNEGLVLTSR